jgi:hypothetical protein
MLAKLQHMAIDFLNAMQAAHVSFLPDGVLDSLIESTERGNRRLSGVDLQKPRMRSVAEAILHLAPNPDGFTVQELADAVRPSFLFAKEKATGRIQWPLPARRVISPAWRDGACRTGRSARDQQGPTNRVPERH